jgi:hypothetical protein
LAHEDLNVAPAFRRAFLRIGNARLKAGATKASLARNSGPSKRQTFNPLESGDWKQNIRSLNWLFQPEECRMDQEKKILK